MARKNRNNKKDPGLYRVTMTVVITTTALNKDHAIEKMAIGGKIPNGTIKVDAEKI